MVYNVTAKIAGQEMLTGPSPQPGARWEWMRNLSREDILITESSMRPNVHWRLTFGWCSYDRATDKARGIMLPTSHRSRLVVGCGWV